MSVLGVLEQFRLIGAQTPGIVSAYKGIPENAPDDDKLPACLAYLDYERPGTLVLGNLEEWGYPVRVDLLVKRAGNIQGEEQQAIPLLEAYLAELRNHATLGGEGYIVADSEWGIGQRNLHDTIYVGASWRGWAGSLDDAAHLIQP